LGLSFEKNEIRFKYPTLPEFLDEIWIRDLRVKGGKVDLYLKKYREDVVVNVIKKEGEVKILVEK